MGEQVYKQVQIILQICSSSLHGSGHFACRLFPAVGAYFSWLFNGSTPRFDALPLSSSSTNHMKNASDPLTNFLSIQAILQDMYGLIY